MRTRSMPTIHCDSEYGCDEWDVDYYETGASSVDGTNITRTERAPGWISTDDEDYCTDHKETRNA